MSHNALVVVGGEAKEMFSFPPVAVLMTGWLGPVVPDILTEIDTYE